jgi:hypothetical protein
MQKTGVRQLAPGEVSLEDVRAQVGGREWFVMRESERVVAGLRLLLGGRVDLGSPAGRRCVCARFGDRPSARRRWSRRGTADLGRGPGKRRWQVVPSSGLCGEQSGSAQLLRPGGVPTDRPSRLRWSVAFSGAAGETTGLRPPRAPFPQTDRSCCGTVGCWARRLRQPRTIQLSRGVFA